MLLLAAGLLLQSAARLVNVDPGFRSDNVITFQVGLPMSRYMEPAARVRFIEGVVENLSQRAGCERRRIRRLCADGVDARDQAIRDRRPAAAGAGRRADRDRSAGRAGLRRRDGTEGDRRPLDQRARSADSPPVVVISESFAKQYFPGERAVGRRLRYYGGRPNAPPPPMPEIVGVVSDVRQFAMAEREAPQMYVPHTQRPWTFTSFFVRTSGDPRAVMGSLPAAVHALDPDRPLEDIQTL